MVAIAVAEWCSTFTLTCWQKAGMGVAQVLVEDAGSQRRAAGRCAQEIITRTARLGGSLKQREALALKHKPRRARSCVGCRCDEALAFVLATTYQRAPGASIDTPDVAVVVDIDTRLLSLSGDASGINR